MWMDGLDPLWEHSVRVIVVFCLLSGHIGQSNGPRGVLCLLVTENNYLDFSGIQTEAYWLFSNHTDILSAVKNKIKYLMIDEYQDTNYFRSK